MTVFAAINSAGLISARPSDGLRKWHRESWGRQWSGVFKPSAKRASWSFESVNDTGPSMEIEFGCPEKDSFC